MERPNLRRAEAPGRARGLGAGEPAPDASMTERIERVERYMRGCGLLRHPRQRSRLRTELATFMTSRLDDIVREWVLQISAAFGIPESEQPGLRDSITAATERWIRHIDNPEDTETYLYLRSHARRGFLSQFAPSRFLATQMKLRAIVAEFLSAEYRSHPEKRDALLGLLQQEFQERILHVTDFFVEAREEELREHEESYRNLVDHAPVAMWTLEDPSGRILDANVVALRIVGSTREELEGRTIWDLLPPAEHARVESLFEETRRKGHSSSDDVHLATKAGGRVPVLLAAGLIEFGAHRFLQAICIDISDRKQLENQLIQSEKMAAIGQLAAGIAHEIRNPLGIIMNALYDLGEILDTNDPEVEEDLRIAKEEMARVQAIINNLLEFSRESRAELEPVDINELLRRTLQLMNKSFQNNDVRVVGEFGPLPPCMANLNALRQIFLNLITNAIQAMPNGGELRLRTHLLPGNRIRLEFRDTGVGIPKEHLRRIFDPFFTTKAPGQGTGLGLSVVHSVVKSLQGTIRVESQVGEGTTFTIELPCRTEPESARR
ncbi:MAG: hypothetical protein KatS3mg076_0280 [Candidatus Binatia bacterium]|nr:MAG: hypothetical protein KatS3mg076_0280 [Candidatus Binatia bacterium]